jgi:hypothetical protein
VKKKNLDLKSHGKAALTKYPSCLSAGGCPECGTQNWWAGRKTSHETVPARGRGQQRRGRGSRATGWRGRATREGSGGADQTGRGRGIGAVEGRGRVRANSWVSEGKERARG